MVRSVASGGKFYRLLPDRENTAFIMVYMANFGSRTLQKCYILLMVYCKSHVCHVPLYPL